MSAFLYRWPPAARFGRVVPKSRFYAHASISTALRQKFVSEIERISWTYKLAEETIRLRGDDAVPEIQVFGIEIKGDDLSEDALTAIDRSVRTPIVFEITRPLAAGGQVRMTAAQKQLGGGAPRLSTYLTTDWLPGDASRVPLPPALDLATLYVALLTPILPITARRGEKLSDAIGRIEQVRKLEREIATLERKLRTEPQFNRKVDLRRDLLTRQAKLTELTAPATPTTEDTPWTS